MVTTLSTDLKYSIEEKIKKCNNENRINCIDCIKENFSCKYENENGESMIDVYKEICGEKENE